MKISRLFSLGAIMMAALFLASCTGKKFHLSGNISNAKDSLLYFENMSLNGPVTVDSVKLGEDRSMRKLPRTLNSIVFALQTRL